MLELEKQVLDKMPLIVLMPVNVTLLVVGDTTGNNCHAAATLHPRCEAFAVVTLVRNNQLAAQVKTSQKFPCIANIVVVAA